ncbi:hypothetical protein Scep_003428 [Stephania cephalantha]|uniref:Uncharacterized protein n=1 Tax=Stephania cephalantha TaxID=152367 RepID=A0AAP0KT09_9MAGN
MAMESDPHHTNRPPSFLSFTPSPPRLVSLSTPTPPTPLRSSSSSSFSWVSLQGRLVGAEEATAARTVGGGLREGGPDVGFAWDLFSPLHRVLVVSVVAAAASRSREVWRLRRAVDLRDRVLLSMQQKLDDLCEQASLMKGWPETIDDDGSMKKKGQLDQLNPDTKSDETKVLSCGCVACDQHRVLTNGSECVQQSAGEEVLKYKMPFAEVAEQEERRMSDISWASSVTSTADIQMSSMAMQLDISNLQRECQEKDTIINQLAAVVNASEVAGSKRVAELEDVIRRKNMIITKMKKDMIVLEQQVMNLTRLRRASSTTATARQLPVMTDNLVYDMDSSSASSSSDSDSDSKHEVNITAAHEDHNICHKENESEAKKSHSSTSDKTPSAPPKPAMRNPTRQSVSPLRENTNNQRPYSASALKPKQSSSANAAAKGNGKNVRRGQKEVTPARRWT